MYKHIQTLSLVWHQAPELPRIILDFIHLLPLIIPPSFHSRILLCPFPNNLIDSNPHTHPPLRHCVRPFIQLTRAELCSQWTECD